MPLPHRPQSRRHHLLDPRASRRAVAVWSGEPKVHELEDPVREAHIGRLEIPMDDPSRVHVCEPSNDLDQHPEALKPREE